jgi:DNA-binding MarR family transcriptional regulator
MNEELSKIFLYPKQVNIMLEILNNPNITMADISKKTQILIPTVCRFIYKLRSFNLLDLTLNSIIKRNKVITLTEEGTNFAVDLKNIISKLNKIERKIKE